MSFNLHYNPPWISCDRVLRWAIAQRALNENRKGMGERDGGFRRKEDVSRKHRKLLTFALKTPKLIGEPAQLRISVANRFGSGSSWTSCQHSHS